MKEPKIYAATPQAKKKLAEGWKPCTKKTGCACASEKPKRAAPIQNEPEKKTEQG